MGYAKWDASLETGNELVDSEHRALFDLISELYDSIVNKDEREVQGDVLVRMVAYAHDHFAHEEALMRSISYPRLDDQMRFHAEFAAETKRLSDQYASGEMLLPITLAIFVYDWLVKHIRVEDRKIGEFIRAQNA